VAGCLFCGIVAGDVRAHVVWESPDVVAFLDIRPVFSGHTLIVPRRHVVTLVDLPDELMVPLFSAVRLLAAAVESDGFGADGSFVASNNRVSQSVPHLHMHVVPRHKGDGLKGFFWPRHAYGSEAQAAEVAARLRAAIADLPRS
jgi:histidine triad (HIT) family protein